MEGSLDRPQGSELCRAFTSLGIGYVLPRTPAGFVRVKNTDARKLEVASTCLPLMRFSTPVKKHWLGSFSIVLPLVCVGSFRLCGTAGSRRETMGGGRGPDAALLGPSPLLPVVSFPPCPSPLWLRSAMTIAGWASGVRLLRVWTLGCDTVPTCPELQSQ